MTVMTVSFTALLLNSRKGYRFEPLLSLQLLINGEWVDAVSGNTFPVLDPRTEQEIIRIAEADSADVDKYVA